MDQNKPAGIETVILPRKHDLSNGFKVRRTLPSEEGRMIGPFILFDHMGPVVFHAGNGFDMGPHPHVGLAAVTYLIDGEITHRDNLGNMQTLGPGEVGWMTAGSGIVHSERTSAGTRASGSNLFGIQAWVALPTRFEETFPSLAHYGASENPRICSKGVEFILISGASDG